MCNEESRKIVISYGYIFSIVRRDLCVIHIIEKYLLKSVYKLLLPGVDLVKELEEFT